MKYDLSQPISQRSIGEKDAENHRIAEIADELRRRSQVYEAESGAGQEHNSLFPDTFYYFIGFAGYDGRSVMPVLQQDLVKDALPATPIEIETYMAAIGFTKMNNEGRFTNNIYEVWDLVPRNVLKDKDGDIYVVDAEIKGN